MQSNLMQPQYVALEAFKDIGPYGRVAFWTSDNAGVTWRQSSKGLPLNCSHVASVDWCPGFWAYAVDPRSTAWYAATDSQGIYRSLDNGATWSLLAGVPDHDAPRIAIDPRHPIALLAAFRGQGVWRWTP